MQRNEQMVDELLVLYLTGNATVEERRDALNWIHENSENRKYFEQLRDAYIASASINKNFDIDRSWIHLKTRYQMKKQSENSAIFRIKDILRYAAIIIIAFLCGGILINKYNHNPLPVSYNQVVAPLGAKAMVELADGTKVWLNAGSKLRYPVNFSANTRDVFLEGEAYFSVTKQMKRKFIVHTEYLNIKVLGTEFNVKAYPEEQTIQTTLVKGAVTIENADNKSILKHPVSLVPNQSASFYKINENQNSSSNSQISPNIDNNTDVQDRSLVLMPQIDPVIYTSWKENRWVIQGEELESLAVKLERRYDVKINITSESLKRYKFSGTLRDETLEQVLNIIKITAPIKFTIENKNVTLEENKTSKKSYDEMLINR